MKNKCPNKLLFALALACTLSFAGCSSATRNVVTPAAAAAYVWGKNYPVFDDGQPETILKFPIGTPTPNAAQATLTLPSSCDGGPLATDSAGQLYVGCFWPNSAPQVLVFPHDSTGPLNPLQTIELNGNYYEITTLAIDAAGKLYVGALKSEPPIGNNAAFDILVYSARTSGQAMPLATIPLRLDDGLADVAVDLAGNIYVAGYPMEALDGFPLKNGDSLSYIDVYSRDPLFPGANRWSKSRTISFSDFAYGLGVDTRGNIFVSLAGVNGGPPNEIEEFAPVATGYANPMKTIQLPAPPAGMTAGGGPIRIDPAGNAFIAIRFWNLSTSTSVLYRFAVDNNSGAALPIAEISPKDSANISFALN